MAGNDQIENENDRRPSWSFIPVLVLYFIIAALVSWIGKAAALLALLLPAVCLWSALSRKQYEQTRRSYPNYPRGDYVLNSIMFHIVIPWGIILVFALLGYLF